MAKNENKQNVRAYRAAQDAAEGVAMAEGLRAAFLELVDAGDMTSEAFLAVCGEGLDEARERAGTDPRPHARRAKALLNGLVGENQGLVERVARRTLGSKATIQANVDEAKQEGSLGLVRAIESYEEESGPFATWAGFWIRYYVQAHMVKQVDFGKHRPACMPASVHRKANVFRNVHGREPGPKDLGIDEATWARWNDNAAVFSTDASAADDGGEGGSRGEIADETPHPDEILMGVHLQNRLAAAMAEMSPRNREITKAIFIDGRTYPDVGAQLGLSQQRVHQLKGVLEKRLREVLAA